MQAAISGATLEAIVALGKHCRTRDHRMQILQFQYQVSILNPGPWTATLNPQPSTFNSQPSTLNP
jgi:hypothetical protein